MKLNPVEYVIYMFNGVRQTARIIGKNPSSVCEWKKRGLIPNSSQSVILEKAKEHNLDITANDLILGREIDQEDERGEG